MAHFNVEVDRLVAEINSIATGLRLKAAAIDEVASRIAASRNPADASQVAELVQGAMANLGIDRLFQQAIRVARAEDRE